MFPKYKSNLKDITFHNEDIDLIQSMYGKPFVRDRFRQNRRRFNNNILYKQSFDN